MKACLFDIDGTLVRVGGAGRLALIAAAVKLCNRSHADVDQVVAAMDFRGRTDGSLLAELAAGLGCAFDAQMLLTVYVDALEETMRQAKIELMPGVHVLLNLLHDRGVQVGLLTGNVREGARRKLRPFGLDHLVDRPGGFGDDGHARSEIACLAVARLHEVGVRPGAVIVVGDTEHDIAAARAAGAWAVAVNTGWTSTDALQRAEPDLHVDNLQDPAPFLALLDRL